MLKLTLHSLRSQTTLLKYILVCFLLFSVFFTWHDSAHAVNTDQACELCLSALDLEHSIPNKVTLFEPIAHEFASIALNNPHFYSEFVAIAGNRDPPSII